MGRLLDKIDAIVRISSGVLLNTPAVELIEDIRTSCLSVKRGDMFIDINNSKEEVQTAVKNGAYCIMSASNYEIGDEEIAWIHTNDLEMGIVKLARYFASKKSLRFIQLASVQFELARCLRIETKARLLSSLPSRALLEILSCEDEALFFVIKNSFITDIDPTVKEYALKKEPAYLLENSIFYTSFAYKERFIKDIRLSAFFVPYLCSLMDLLDELNIEFKIDNFNNFKHFYPRFVSSKMGKRDFGTTRQALIYECDFELFEKELAFLKDRVDENLLISFTCKDKAITVLEKTDFRYALIYTEKDDFDELLCEKKPVQMELF